MGHIKDRWFTKAKTPTARHGKGLRWQVKYSVDGREKDGGSFAKKSDAEKRLTELESNRLRGAWCPSSRPRSRHWRPTDRRYWRRARCR